MSLRLPKFALRQAVPQKSPAASPPLSSGAGHAAGVRQLWVLLVSSFWLASLCNVALWRELTRLQDLTSLQVLTISLALGLVIMLTSMALLSLFAWRWTLKPVITIFLVAAAAGAYFMMTYGVVIDKNMIINALNTDMRETRDLLSLRLFATLALLAVGPSIWLWRVSIRPERPLKRIFSNVLTFVVSMALVLAVVMLFFQSIASVMRNYPQVRYLINPLNSFYALGTIAAKPFQRDQSLILPLGVDAKLGASYAAAAKPPLLLLVLGETARSGNFALNGYKRPTNPELSRQNVVSQQNAWSCGTSTEASVPCMFSNLGRANYESRPANYEGLLDVLQHAGLAVLWIDNQSGCKGACDRIPNVNTTRLALPGFCPNGECFDEVMLQGLDARIAALPAERRAKGVVVVMHQMGGHGPAYYQRSPPEFKKFLPECTSNALQSCKHDALINAYDNSIVYTDHFLSAGIEWLKKQQQVASPAMLYVADHGESLGENNLYLHGMPYSIAPDVQKHVPWITWLSPAFEQRSHITTGCLKKRQDEKVSHDNYFHSVLGLMNIETSVYLPAMDIYAPCGNSANSANLVTAP